MTHSTTVDWQSLVFEPAWMERLDHLAARRFGSGGLAEEASAYVIDKLSESEWAALKSYKGQSSPQSYLHTLAGNFIEEFSRKRFGRPRPPEWVKREGELWTRVWKWVCLERRLPQAVVDLCCDGDLPAMIRKIIQTLKARIPWCGESAREIASNPIADDDGELSPEQLIPEYMTPESSIESEHFRDSMLMLSTLLQDEITPATIDKAATRAQAILDAPDTKKIGGLGDRLQLSDLEWVLLRMVYQDGVKLKAAAGYLGLKAHEPGRIMKQTLDKVADAMAELGVDKDNFVNLL